MAEPVVFIDIIEQGEMTFLEVEAEESLIETGTTDLDPGRRGRKGAGV